MRIKLIDALSAKGGTFTFKDAKNAMGADSSVVKVVLSRLEKRGWIERIEKGKYMIIPMGAEKGKYTVNEFVIGSSLVKPCCIAYWSALHHYGFTEQIPNSVFIQTTARKKKQKIDVFGIRYEIIRVKPEKFFGVRSEWIEEMQVGITDKEKTIADCLDKPQHCGGIIEAAKAFKSENLNTKKLAGYAVKIGNSGAVRRLGYLCDIFNWKIELPKIEARNYLLLDPAMPAKGSRNSKWKLIVNIDESEMGALE